MEEEDDVEESVEALPGGPPSGVDTSELATVILMLTGEMTKLEILLCEIDEDEFKRLAPRLNRLLGVLARIPRPRAVRRVGFQRTESRTSKPRPRTQSSSRKRSR